MEPFSLAALTGKLAALLGKASAPHAASAAAPGRLAWSVPSRPAIPPHVPHTYGLGQLIQPPNRTDSTRRGPVTSAGDGRRVAARAVRDFGQLSSAAGQARARAARAPVTSAGDGRRVAARAVRDFGQLSSAAGQARARAARAPVTSAGDGRRVAARAVRDFGQLSSAAGQARARAARAPVTSAATAAGSRRGRSATSASSARRAAKGCAAWHLPRAAGLTGGDLGKQEALREVLHAT